MLRQIKQQLCQKVKGLFEVLTDKFRLQHSRTIFIPSILYTKGDEIAEKWIGSLRIKASEYKYNIKRKTES